MRPGSAYSGVCVTGSDAVIGRATSAVGPPSWRPASIFIPPAVTPGCSGRRGVPRRLRFAAPGVRAAIRGGPPASPGTPSARRCSRAAAARAAWRRLRGQARPEPAWTLSRRSCRLVFRGGGLACRGASLAGAAATKNRLVPGPPLFPVPKAAGYRPRPKIVQMFTYLRRDLAGAAVQRPRSPLLAATIKRVKELFKWQRRIFRRLIPHSRIGH